MSRHDPTSPQVNLQYQSSAQDSEEFDPYSESNLVGLHPTAWKGIDFTVGDQSTPTNGLKFVGRQRRLGIIPILPALVSSLIAASAASLLLIWLLSRRVTYHSGDEDALFRSAIIAAEGKQSSATDLLGQVLGAEQNTDGGVDATMYGLAMSSVAVMF
jgi:hypothetical protein